MRTVHIDPRVAIFMDLNDPCLYLFIFTARNIFCPVTGLDFRIKSQSWTAIEVLDLPLAHAQILTHEVAVTITWIGFDP